MRGSTPRYYGVVIALNVVKHDTFIRFTTSYKKITIRLSPIN